MKNLSVVVFVVTLCISIPAMAAGPPAPPEINTILMRSTFKIQGENGPLGTAFVLGKPLQAEQGKGKYILVTAGHVLSGFKGESATLFFRKKAGQTFVKFPYVIKIREGEKLLWVQHPDSDVAAMYVSLPRDIDILLASTDLLATDEILEQFDMYPGRQLLTLGYPLGLESNEAGFPVLRSGRIASFPILPSKNLKTFLLDFAVFEGNSGGPVYFFDPDWHKRGSGMISSPMEIQILMGLVSGQKIITERMKSLWKTTEEIHGLSLAEVVHASLIRETVELLDKTK